MRCCCNTLAPSYEGTIVILRDSSKMIVPTKSARRILAATKRLSTFDSASLVCYNLRYLSYVTHSRVQCTRFEATTLGGCTEH
jgi:hypothetical protein